MTLKGKAEFERAVQNLCASGLTAMSIGLTLGHELALDNLSEDSVTSVILMTDGCDTFPCEKAGAQLQRLRGAMRYPVHVMGLGKGVDSHALQAISEAGGGNLAFAFDGSTAVKTLTRLVMHDAFRAACDCRVTFMDTKLAPTQEGLWRAKQTMDGTEFDFGAIGGAGGAFEFEFDREPVWPLNVYVGYQTSVQHQHYFQLNPRAPDTPQKTAACQNAARNTQWLRETRAFVQAGLPHDLVPQDLAEQAELEELRRAVSDSAKWGAVHIASFARQIQLNMCVDPRRMSLIHRFDLPEFAPFIEQVVREFTRAVPVPDQRIDRARFARSFVSDSGTCVTGASLVMVEGQRWVRADAIVKGDLVVNPLTNTAVPVRCVVESRVKGRKQVVEVNSLLTITPWHPIFRGDCWQFPADTAVSLTEVEDETFFSFLLEACERPAMNVGMRTLAVLGHGETQDPILAHPYFTAKVVDDLKEMPGFQEGRVIVSGVRRDAYAVTQLLAQDDVQR